MGILFLLSLLGFSPGQAFAGGSNDVDEGGDDQVEILSWWYALQNEMKAALGENGKSKCIVVDDLSGEEPEFTLKVHVKCKNDLQAKALGSLLIRDWHHGNITVHVRVFHFEEPVKFEPFPSRREDVKEAKKWITAALDGSGYFSSVIEKGPGSGPYALFVEFKKDKDVQFWSDDLSTNQVTTRVAEASHAYLLRFYDIAPLKIGVTTQVKP